MDFDREGIVDVLVRYARAIDTRDWPLFRTCFADDVAADYGDIGSWHGVEDITAFMIAAHAGMGPTQHALTNFVIDIEGDRARSATYVHAVTVLATHPDDWIDTMGIHEDQLHRQAEGWRITNRIFRTTRMIVSPSLSAGVRSGPSGSGS
jgi:hypothetical protein